MAVTETTVITSAAIKAGSLAAAIALLTTDMELTLVFITGLIGGLIFAFKEITHLEVKTTKLKAFSELLFTIPVSISVSAIVYYVGAHSLNKYFPLHNVVWISLSMLASLHFRSVLKFFTSVFSRIINNFADKGSK